MSQDIEVMLRYAMSEGMALDKDTQEKVVAAESGDPSFEKLMAAHTALSKLVGPATPASLQATEPGGGLWGVFKKPPIIGWTTLAALVFAIGFIVTIVFTAPAPVKTDDKPKPPVAFILPTVQNVAAPSGGGFVLVADAPLVNPRSLAQQLNWFCAAGLGATFYVLVTVHEYVKNRTFDPRYNSLYAIRVVLGIVSGLILGNFAAASIFSADSTLSKLGPGLIALLGGFSVEAVTQVLQRLVDILLAAVRGDNSGAAKAKAVQATQKELLGLAADPALPPAAQTKVHEVLKKVT